MSGCLGPHGRCADCNRLGRLRHLVGESDRARHPRPMVCSVRVLQRFNLVDQQPPDLAGLGVAAKRFLGEQQLPIDAELVDATLAGDQRPGGNLEFQLALAQDFFRQTDGSWGIPSHGAVVELDLKSQHGHPPGDR